MHFGGLPDKIMDAHRYPAGVIVIFLTLMATWAGAELRPWRQGSEPRKMIGQGVDPNLAPWWELALLPRLGPSISQEIVAHRTRKSAEQSGATCVFRSSADLLTVRGIGPKMLLRLGPHLRFGGCAAESSDDLKESTVKP